MWYDCVFSSNSIVCQARASSRVSSPSDLPTCKSALMLCVRTLCRAIEGIGGSETEQLGFQRAVGHVGRLSRDPVPASSSHDSHDPLAALRHKTLGIEVFAPSQAQVGACLCTVYLRACPKALQA